MKNDGQNDGIGVLGARLQQRLDETGMNQSDLARRTGLHRDAISRLLLGKTRSPRADNLDAIAREVNASQDWLSGRTDTFTPYAIASAPVRQLVSIPVVGTVEAGAFRPVPDAVDESTMRHVEIARHARFQNFQRFAFDVAGDSMTEAGIGDGDIVVCVDWSKIGMAELSGLIVVVERRINGGHLREWTVKEIEAFDDKIVLHPRSKNQAHKPIEIRRDYAADNGTEVQIIALVVNVMKNVFRF